jgi:membrane-bound serine protease (ClpP class)
MKALLFPLVLQLIGVLVVIAEVILPSGGLLSLVAIGIFSYSLYSAYLEAGRTAALVLAGIDLVMLPILIVTAFKMLARSSLTLHTELKRTGGVSSQAADLEKYVGLEGKTITTLRPSGTAILDGHRVDVVSQGDFIEKDADVVVVSVTGNQVIVARKEG